MRIGSLFAGIGGFDLAAASLGWSTAWVSEIDPFASAVLAHHFPDAPNLGDVTRIDWSTVERPDILCGGFPCQPHSLAGKRQASADDRDLFHEVIRAVGVLRPRYVVLENVPGLLTSESGGFFNRVLSELAALGYVGCYDVLSAAECGAPHKRERVWIVAYPRHDEQSGWSKSSCSRSREPRPESAPRSRPLDQLAESDVRRRPDRESGLDANHGGESTFGDAASGGGRLDDANGGRREQRHARKRESAELGTGLIPVGDSANRGRGTGAGVELRRVERRCDGVGDTDDAGWEGLGRPIGFDGASGRDAQGRHGAPPSVHVRLPDWSDAIPYRGADGTVRLIPRGAVADRGNAEPSRAGGESRPEQAEYASGVVGDAIRRGKEEVTRPEPAIRPLAHGLPDRLAGRDHGGEEAEPWASPKASDGSGGRTSVTEGGGNVHLDKQAREYANAGGSLWPVTDNEPGRVAKLRAIGNAVVPAWVVAGPFAKVIELESLSHPEDRSEP